MRGFQRSPFSTDLEFVALADFTFAGRKFKRGRKFPWRDLGCGERRLEQMYASRRIGTAAELT